MSTPKHDVRQNRTFGARMRMFVRFLGLTALLAAGVGAIFLAPRLPNWKPESLIGAVKNDHGLLAMIGALMLAGGILVAIFTLVVEMFAATQGGTSGRGAVGANAIFQSALAIALVIAINVYAFMHPASFDLTVNRQFTLPDDIVKELQNLKSDEPTTIVVLQQHKAFGRLSEKPDRFDYAAERKVVEKVYDTVDLFRKFGPQFNVVVLDVEEENYNDKFKEVTNERPVLRDAINAAPENSIFFYAQNKVQRMSFNEFYQLDKQASIKKGNLVLHPQGIETLVKRITAIEEKRPKVAIGVTHPYLTTDKHSDSGADDYTLAGLKKSLNEYGIDVVDVVLKKNYRAELEGDPATFTLEETQLMKLEDKFDTARDNLRTEKAWGDRLARNMKKIDSVKDKELKDRIDTYLDAFGDQRRLRIAISPQDRKDPEVLADVESTVLRFFQSKWKEHLQDLADAEETMARIEKELQKIKKSERSIEDRYLTDHVAKLKRLLADCDMLIIPRMTIMNAANRAVLPRALHKLDRTQIDVIKDFMKSGKPVLVCAGPINNPNEEVPDGDELESTLRQCGIELSKQTVLFNVERESFRGGAQDEGDELTDRSVEVPPVQFTPPEGLKIKGLKPNPLVSALTVLNDSVDKPLDIRIRAARPVTVTREQQEAQKFDAAFLWTNPRSWAENYPFDIVLRLQPNPFTMQPQRTMSPRPIPRYDPPDETKKSNPLYDPEYRGPVPIAVAVEAKLPESWYSEKEKDMDRKSIRLVVVGHGSLFNRPELSPASERLLLVISNWLLKRDDRLPHKADPQAAVAADRPWEYPRVEMKDGSKPMWRWAAFLGLPAVCIYLGLVVLMVRKVR